MNSVNIKINPEILVANENLMNQFENVMKIWLFQHYKIT